MSSGAGKRPGCWDPRLEKPLQWPGCTGQIRPDLQRWKGEETWADGQMGGKGFVSCWRVELNMCQKDQLKDLLPNSVQVESVLWELPSPRSLALKRQRHVLGVDKTLGTVKAERRQLLSL